MCLLILPGTLLFPPNIVSFFLFMLRGGPTAPTWDQADSYKPA